MPYTADTVPSSVPKAKAAEWAGRFNGVLEEMKKKGMDQKTAEEHAFKAANAMLGGTAMADFNNAWIQIFRAGDYGAKGKWSAEDVKKAALNFDPAIWQPPAVLGHPETDSPAMGLVSALRESGGVLEAQFTRTHPVLEALVSDGRYPNRSAAFYIDPQGKGPMLRHVGFLGATAPEVKGLAPVSFSSEEFVEVEFNEEGNVDVNEMRKTVGEEVRGFVRKLFSEERPAGAQFTEEQVQERITAANKPLMDSIAALRTEFTEARKADQAAATSAGLATAKARVDAFVEKQRTAGRWVPAFDGLIPVLEEAAASGREFEFSEGQGEKKKTVKVPSFEGFAKFFETLGAIVPQGELVKKHRKGGAVIQFNEPKDPHTAVDEESVALAERAQAIAGEKKISYGQALTEARREVGA